MDPVFLFGGLAALAVAAIVLGVRAASVRRKQLEALAAELGLSFDPRKDRGHDDEYAQFAVFRRGSSRVAYNTMRGHVDLFGRRCRVCAGDFRYETTSGSGENQSTTTHDLSYLIVHPPWRTPPLLVRPEGFFDKVAGAFGFDDIDFESVEFSRRFFVKSPDKRFAYDVLHPRMMEFLLANDPLVLDVEAGALCITDGDRRWNAAGFRANFGFVQRFAELWPRHLVQQLEA